jgi:hypothetical protein
VDDNGKVKVQGNGEAAITVWYQSRVSFSRITDPFASRIDSAALRGLHVTTTSMT